MASQFVAIIDSGGANIASLRVALSRLRTESTVTSNPATIRAASHVILPGVGSAANAMTRLHENNLIETIAALRQPVLGICLGMQLLARASEEDDAECLGIVGGVTRKLQATPKTPVPNIGWCRVYHTTDHPLLDGIEDGSYFYFLHSYAFMESEYALGTAVHHEHFSAVLARGNFFGTQFHPEKSSAVGMRLLENYLGM